MVTPTTYQHTLGVDLITIMPTTHLYTHALYLKGYSIYKRSGDERARIYQLFSESIKFFDGVGIFSSFDNVILVREPNNPFDTNSVLVILASNNHEVLGHLERSIAAGIAELMDKFKSQVKGMLMYNNIVLECTVQFASFVLIAVLAFLEKYSLCEPGSKNYKHRSTDILISICGELHLQSDVEIVLKNMRSCMRYKISTSLASHLQD